MKTFPSEDAGEEDLQTDADEDDAAQDGRLAGQLGAELFADVQTGHAEDEGDCGDDDRCRQRIVQSYSEMVKPTERASMLVATPCTKRAPALSSMASSVSSPRMPSTSILPPMYASRMRAIHG